MSEFPLKTAFTAYVSDDSDLVKIEERNLLLNSVLPTFKT